MDKMAKKMLIDATHAEETRVVVVDGNKVEEFDFESENKRQLAGNIYLAKVTRVEPSLQAAFVEYGGNRHGFLAFSEIHPDYYQIPVADRRALMEEEAALAAAADEEEEKPRKTRSRSRRKPSKSEKPAETATGAADAPREISGMETIDFAEDEAETEENGPLSPMERVAETPVEEPDGETVGTAEETAADTPVSAAEADADEVVADAPVEAVEDVAETGELAGEDAGAETAEAPADPAEADADPVAAAEAAGVAPADGSAAEEAAPDEAAADVTAPQRPMAEESKEEALVVSTEPGAGVDQTESAAEVVSDAEEAPDAVTDADAPAPVAETAVADDVAAVSDMAEPVAESPDAEMAAQAEPDAGDAVEAAAPAEPEDAAAPDAATDEDAVETDADTGEAGPDDSAEGPAPEDAPDAAAADETARDDAEDNGVAKRSDAASRDESIESVADDDDEEDIRPARKPRPRRYKIQEVIKVRQIMLVQVVKEERGNKGAALTTYLSLAGRYCVLMPNTARGGGISRKITNAADRQKLKAIAQEIDVPKGAGLIIRTAGAQRTKTEIKRDYEYLQRLWEQIRALTLQSIAPAKIYEEGDLIKRSIRDLYSREIDEVLVEGERGYRIAKDFMKMIMPSHAKNVQQYQDPMPLFARYQVESYLGGMFNPVVQLKSGGYIVIGVTEALVAIDVNSGRATKEGSIEETALKTNLEAAEEVARQLRLRDLAGLIVIDFIDMDERKNNAAVEKKLKDKLKTDRARIQVGRISGFGLLEMSRQRLRPGMIEATTQPCPSCHGTGLIRSDDNMALQILRQIEEEGVRRRSREVLVKCPVGIANYLMNQKREHVAMIEARYGLSVRIEGDVHLVSPDFALEKFKTATRIVPEAQMPVVSVDTSIMDQVDEDSQAEDEEEVAEVQVVPADEAEGLDEDKPKKRRRRRRRRSKSKDGETGSESQGQEAEASPEAEAEAGDESEAAEAAEGEAEKPRKTRTRRSRSRSRSKSSDPEATEGADAGEAAETVAAASDAEAAAEAAADAPVPAEVTDVAPGEADAAVADAPSGSEGSDTAKAETPPKPRRTRRKASDVIAAVTGVAETDPVQAEADSSPAEVEPVAAAEPVAKAEPVAAAEPMADADPAEAPSPAPVAQEAVASMAEAKAIEAEEAPAMAEDSAAPSEASAEPDPAPEPEPVAAEPEPAADDTRPKRRGWWSLGR